VFGVGPQEMVVVVGLLALLVFGPTRVVAMARELGSFVGKARRSADEFKEEVASSTEHTGRRTS
jgi:Sec-independent protein translocase protein TatA